MWHWGELVCLVSRGSETQQSHSTSPRFIHSSICRLYQTVSWGLSANACHFLGYTGTHMCDVAMVSLPSACPCLQV